jgi:intracellular septation protein
MNKGLFDFFPAVLFFLAYFAGKQWVYPVADGADAGQQQMAFLFATVIFIIASVIQVALYWFTYKTVKKLHLITLVLVLFMGGLTLYFQNDLFLKWKFTVVHWIFTLAFIGSQYIGKKTLMERMLGGNMELPKPIWIKLNFSWAMFFAFVGALNVYVFTNYDTDTWMFFKMFGVIGLTIVFAFASILSVSKHIPNEET